jgi:Fe-S oxidoreductase
MFLGCYANFNDPQGYELATLDVLGDNNFKILLPDFRCCGIARINSGAIDQVMKDVRFNVEIMTSYVEQGLDIVFSEPSCALAVKMEYPKILDTETSRRVARRCYDIHQFLMMLQRKGELSLDLGELDLTVGYHNPCHLRALGAGNDVVELLESIPGVRVRGYTDGCCGLGGIFGMKKENFDLSMKIGSRLFQEINDSEVDEIVTSCAACAMQIFQGTNRRAIHPISLLAMAYKKET